MTTPKLAEERNARRRKTYANKRAAECDRIIAEHRATRERTEALLADAGRAAPRGKS